MMTFDITLPLVGTLELPFILVAPVVTTVVFCSVLFAAIHFDNKKDGN
jgi:hypothetical protein